MSDPTDKSMQQVILEDGRYPPGAYGFLHEGLMKAVEEVHGTEGTLGAHKHVSGQELCRSLRDLATERWGQLARTVLAKWNIHATIDFGNMVFVLVNANFMWATEADSVEDFRDVYDFDE
ncbi:unnamed protein product, partial [marine sediment metagenome]